MNLYVADNIIYDTHTCCLYRNCTNQTTKRDVRTIQYDKSLPVTGAYFILTNACNLNCVYCFARSERRNDALCFDTAKPLLQKIIGNAMIYRAVNGVEIIPYIKFSGGGEPTLNFETMKRIVDFVDNLVQKHCIPVEYHLATNGQWNNSAISSWINDHITNLLFSVDGTSLVNNKHRPRKDMRDSYVAVVEKLREITNPNIKYTFRMTVSNYSVVYMQECVSVFRDLGINNIQIEPLMPFEEKRDIYEPLYSEFAERYIETKYEYKDINVESSFDVLENNSMGYCGHQLGNIVSIFPNGVVTSCPERPINSEYIRGVSRNGKLSLSPNLMENRGLKQCGECVISNLCLGICPSKITLFQEKNMDPDYMCDLYRAIFIKHIKKIVEQNKLRQYNSFVYDIVSKKLLYVAD